MMPYGFGSQQDLVTETTHNMVSTLVLVVLYGTHRNQYQTENVFLVDSKSEAN